MKWRRGIRIPPWYLLLLVVLGILSCCESLRYLERFARRHHVVLGEQLGLKLLRPPSDSAFRYFFLQVDVVAICGAIRDWTIAQIPDGAADIDQLACDGKTLRGSIEPTAGGGPAFIAQVPGVNYVGGSRQLRRRVTPCPPPAMAGGGDSEK
ncbi:MAG: hypothetical protein NTY67_01810 [Cyanobacteria bacterium]|nr:hypothetical protein [Cyanobacteriota bacterium]